MAFSEGGTCEVVALSDLEIATELGTVVCVEWGVAVVSNVWQTSFDAAGTPLLLSHCVVTNGGCSTVTDSIHAHDILTGVKGGQLRSK